MNEHILKRMKQFELSAPYCISMLQVDEEGMPLKDEAVAVKDGKITYAITAEHSIATLNELVAKAKLGIEYGELLTNYSFNGSANKEQVKVFFNINAPIINTFAFMLMKQYLSTIEFAKEIKEWTFFLESLLSFNEPDHEVQMSAISIYVPLVSQGAMENKVPKELLKYKVPIETLLALVKERPSPQLMCKASNLLAGAVMAAKVVDREDGTQMFHLKHTEEEIAYI